MEKEGPGLPSGRSVRTTFSLQKTFQQTSGSKGKCRKQKKVIATAVFSWSSGALKFKAGKRRNERKDREDGEKAAIPFLKRARGCFCLFVCLLYVAICLLVLCGFVLFIPNIKKVFLSTQLVLRPNASWWTRHICPSSE